MEVTESDKAQEKISDQADKTDVENEKVAHLEDLQPIEEKAVVAEELKHDVSSENQESEDEIEINKQGAVEDTTAAKS